MDLDSLFRQHSASMFRYLVRFTGDADLAADAVQEAFTRLAERPPRADGARTWLFRVATNVAMERERTRRRRLRLLAAGPWRASAGDEPPDPAERVERDEREREVRRALDSLNPRDRTALLMRAEGFAHHEIGAALGCNPKAVGSILDRALRKLSERLHLDDEGAP